ncbi:MAG TPA: O-antigen ligase family protein, partial [Allosphingosinicella sp.]|nr:O-antigen ligase family protein [Allosphingosinicella sp.]
MLKRRARPGPSANMSYAERAPSRLGFWLAAALVVCGVALGGRSGGTPLSEALMRILAVGLLVWLAFAPRRAAGSRLVNASLILMVATLVVAALQLVPLPEGLWRSMSGGPVAANILESAGESIGLRPLTLNIDGTRETILTLLPPFALFLAVIELDAADRRRLALFVLIIAAASVVVGLLQFASRTGLYPYETTHEGYSVGLFSNRNHQADLTLIAALLGSAFYAGRKKSPQSTAAVALLGLAFFAIIGLNLMAAASRGGILMALPALSACAVILFGGELRKTSTLAAGLGIVVVASIYLIMRPDLFAHIFERFGAAGDDARLETWPDVLRVIQMYLPFGSGLGTFVPVYQAIENLDLVGERYLNHAHNDYLEIALEMGIPGILLVGCFFILFLWAAKNALLGPADRAYRLLCGAAVVGIVVLLGHSVVDYPMRTSTLALVFALLFGLLMPLPAGNARRRRQEHGP